MPNPSVRSADDPQSRPLMRPRCREEASLPQLVEGSLARDIRGLQRTKLAAHAGRDGEPAPPTERQVADTLHYCITLPLLDVWRC